VAASVAQPGAVPSPPVTRRCWCHCQCGRRVAALYSKLTGAVPLARSANEHRTSESPFSASTADDRDGPASSADAAGQPPTTADHEDGVDLRPAASDSDTAPASAPSPPLFDLGRFSDDIISTEPESGPVASRSSRFEPTPHATNRSPTRDNFNLNAAATSKAVSSIPHASASLQAPPASAAAAAVDSDGASATATARGSIAPAGASSATSTSSTSVPLEPLGWTCGTCTLRNSVIDAACAACGSVAPGKVDDQRLLRTVATGTTSPSTRTGPQPASLATPAQPGAVSSARAAPASGTARHPSTASLAAVAGVTATEPPAHSLVLSNINFFEVRSEAMLKQLFSTRGFVVSRCHLQHKPPPHSTHLTGDGWVMLKRPGLNRDAVAAVNGIMIGSRQLRVQEASALGNAPTSVSAPASEVRGVPPASAPVTPTQGTGVVAMSAPSSFAASRPTRHMHAGGTAHDTYVPIICQVCFVRPRDTVLNCEHTQTCSACLAEIYEREAVPKCPFCKTVITAKMRIRL
jgi:hypothetical protein